MTAETPTGGLFTETTFEQLELSDEIRRAVDDLGFTHLTQVQDQVLPLTLSGRDVAVQAQTGTGKTATYLITIFEHALRRQRPEGADGPRALIVTPTRELAVQVAHDAEALGRYTGLKTLVVFGGLDYHKQRDELRQGVDLLVGTPGRLIDYHKQRVYSLRNTELLVIDECDRLFDMGFAEDLQWILRRLPHPKDRQSMMYTATLSYRVMTLGWRQMNNPVEIVINPENITPEAISQRLYHVGAREKLSLLLGLLEHEGAERTMIFVNTRYMAKRLVEDLRRHSYEARALTGNVMQRRRLKVLDDFKDGSLPILVATDVASRGLHIEGVSHVINYDLPQDPEDYVHRIGRTARAGAEGKAISLACEDFVYSLDGIQKLVGYEIPAVVPQPELFAEVIPFRRSRRTDHESSRRPRKAAPGRAPARSDNDAGGDTKPRRRRPRRHKPKPDSKPSS
ncbi:MAG: DEAD/DEAH box helicase [Acidobacteria bacterium]|nr:DEAD/DEAH box helicase [Acidobacteriota bacterium]